MKETTITRAILKALNALPHTKAIKLPGGPHLEAGTPDILCVSQGKAYLLEVKRPDGRGPTRLQQRRVWEWRLAGATALVVRSVDEALEAVGNGQTRP